MGTLCGRAAEYSAQPQQKKRKTATIQEGARAKYKRSSPNLKLSGYK